DSSQPNLGDYIAAVVNRRGDLLGAYAITRPVLFRDGQPGASMTVPEPAVSTASASQQTRITTVDFRGATATELSGHSDGNGFLDPGEIGLVSISLRNDVTNPMSARAISRAVAKVESRTPGAHLLLGTTVFPALAPGETGT